MKMNRILLLALLGVALGATAQTTEERLAQLEKEIAGLKSETSSQPSDKVNLGGYGELHYNNLSGNGSGKDKREVDFHRFVIFMGYEYNERIRFNSELELEHSLSGNNKPGEVELEQAYMDFDINDSHTARGGLFLLPIGILNDTHEPTTFYGVERNAVEKNIIPTTWWEAGFGMYGELAGDFSYAAYIHSGLQANTNYVVRGGREKVAKANANNLAGTLAINWQVPGITIGGSLHYQSDITQETLPDAGDALLAELHTDIQKGAFGLRALFAQWALDGDGPEDKGADKQYGWYIEPSYKVFESLGLFARMSEWQNQEGNQKTQYDAGINWWPHEQVVVKADYQWQENENGKDQAGINLGIGYDF